MIKNLVQPTATAAYFTNRDRGRHPMIVSVFAPDTGWVSVPISKGADPAKDSRVTAASCRAMARMGVTAVQVLGWHHGDRAALADFQITELI
jgi:hypothetical protein